MRHNFDEIINRRVSECKKYEAACYPEDVLPMWIADTDFAVPAEISEAIQQRAKHPCFGYPIESFEFEEAAARWERVRFGWNVDPHWVKYANGVLPFLMYAIRAYSYPGDKVVIQPPVYPPFSAIVRNNGRQLLENRLVQDENGKYQIDFDDLEKKLKDPRTKLFFMSNPHNPAMRCFTLEELKRIGELCLKYNVLVISDEIHCDLTYQGYKHIPFGSISEEFANNCIVLINPSKTFNIAGFRTGAAIIPNKRIRDNIEITIVNNKNYGRTIFGMLTFVTAYTKCDYYADEMMQYLQQSRDMIYEGAHPPHQASRTGSDLSDVAGLPGSEYDPGRTEGIHVQQSKAGPERRRHLRYRRHRLHAHEHRLSAVHRGTGAGAAGKGCKRAVIS